MAQQFLLIDGYNLLHAAGLARTRYGPGDFERVRNRLLRLLAFRLDADERARTTIVFDAALNDEQNASRQQVCEQLTVIFSPYGVDADTVIEQLIAAHSSPKQLSVVSDDQRLRTAAQRRRATPIACETFFNDLMDREPLTPESSMETTSTTTNPHSATLPAVMPPQHETPRPLSNVTDKDWDIHIDHLEADLKSRRHRHD